MPRHPDQNSPGAYRARLLNTLLAADLEHFFKELGIPYPTGDSIEARHIILNGWNDHIQSAIIEYIINRLD